MVSELENVIQIETFTHYAIATNLKFHLVSISSTNATHHLVSTIKDIIYYTFSTNLGQLTVIKFDESDGIHRNLVSVFILYEKKNNFHVFPL